MNWWGRWGADDERGAANLVDAAATLRGIAEVRTGQVHGLARRMEPGRGSGVVGRAPLQHFMARTGADYVAGHPERGGFGFADDSIVMATHGETHVDALAHLWQDGRIYNGFSAGTITSGGAERCGIEAAGVLVTRGILVDFVGDGAALAPGEAVRADRLRDAIAATGATPQAGDALLVRTGWTEIARGSQAPPEAWPGLHGECAQWIAEHELAIVGADNVAVEAHPSADPACQAPLHVALLRDRGIYLCELLKLDELAAAGRSTFLFVLAPLPLVGAVGSPVNPVAVL